VNYASLSIPELISACTETNHPLAWEEFVRRFHSVIASVAFHTARRWSENSPQVVEELVQETYLKLCAEDASILRSFESKHPDSFCGFLKVLTANLAHDYFKGRKSQKRGGMVETISSTRDEQPATNPEPQSDSLRKIERGVLVREIDDCLRSVVKGANADRDRKIFWLYYRIGLSAEAIAAMPQMRLTTKGVESTLGRLTRDIRAQIAVERRTKGIEPSESFY
jgi:RNA polymerase sigma-70 factor (ECF subfamily)